MIVYADTSTLLKRVVDEPGCRRHPFSAAGVRSLR